MKVEEGDIVTVHFTVKKEDGFIVGTSDSDIAKKEKVEETGEVYKPLTLKAGLGQTLEGLDDALIGMNEGEKKEVMVSPEKAFGPTRDELIKDLPLSSFKSIDLEPNVGMMIKTTEGSMGMVKSVGGSAVEVDFNHPLAGESLVFDIEILDIKKDS